MMLIEVSPDIAFLILRLALAAVFLAHGPAKLQKSQQIAEGLGLTSSQVVGIGSLEVLGAISLILGVYTQLGALFLVIVMLGAIYFKAQKWSKNFTGEGGWEFEFLLLAAALAVMLAAPSTYSLIP